MTRKAQKTKAAEPEEARPKADRLKASPISSKVAIRRRRARRRRRMGAHGRTGAQLLVRGLLPLRRLAGKASADERLLPGLGGHPHRRGPCRRDAAGRRGGRHAARHSRPDGRGRLVGRALHRRGRQRRAGRGAGVYPLGQAGGTTGLFRLLVANFLGTRRVPVTYSVEDGVRRCRPGAPSWARSRPIDGAEPGREVAIENTTYWMGSRVVIARGLKSKLRDFGRVWTFDDCSAELCHIEWAASVIPRAALSALPGERIAGIGHNQGPPLEAGRSWRAHAWRQGAA